MNYYSYETESFKDLTHYGVLGMKWGVRRYQNPDGSLTSEGRKRARAEYKQDNKDAFRNGQLATIGDRAYGYAAKGKKRADARYEKRQNERTRKRKDIADKTEKILAEEKALYDKKARDHYNELVQKYGKEAVSEIKYDKKGRYNERIHTGQDWTEALGQTIVAGMIARAVGIPVSPIFYPSTKNETAKYAYAIAKKKAKQEYKKEHS